MSELSSDNTSLPEDRIIPSFAILIIVLVFIFLTILILPDFFPSSSGTAVCGSGLCVNDINTGQKTCPTDNSMLSYDPVYQTCNPPTGCSPTSNAPCVYSDPTVGSVCPGNLNYNSGNCPNSGGTGSSGSVCPCVGRLICPDFATVYFQIQNITTPGLSPDCTNLTVFVQNTVWTDSFGLAHTDLPLSPGLAVPPPPVVCGLTQSQLPNMWPPNTCVKGNLTLSAVDNLYYCMNSPDCPDGQIPLRQTNGVFTCTTNPGIGTFD